MRTKIAAVVMLLALAWSSPTKSCWLAKAVHLQKIAHCAGLE